MLEETINDPAWVCRSDLLPYHLLAPLTGNPAEVPIHPT